MSFVSRKAMLSHGTARDGQNPPAAPWQVIAGEE